MFPRRAKVDNGCSFEWSEQLSRCVSELSILPVFSRSTKQRKRKREWLFSTLRRDRRGGFRSPETVFRRGNRKLLTSANLPPPNKSIVKLPREISKDPSIRFDLIASSVWGCKIFLFFWGYVALHYSRYRKIGKNVSKGTFYYSHKFYLNHRASMISRWSSFFFFFFLNGTIHFHFRTDVQSISSVDILINSFIKKKKKKINEDHLELSNPKTRKVSYDESVIVSREFQLLFLYYRKWWFSADGESTNIILDRTNRASWHQRVCVASTKHDARSILCLT